ncbi:CHC2 zinc finger domain-containing protein [Dokdonella soli]|uniref:Toprim domain-containing protein n=1 Tax=Dokdonella soli TaxID=529810 RepID=A0ABN1INP7_9GAMM
MARIPDVEIERLKAEVSLVRLIASAGIALKAHGQDVIGRCPFHDDKTPSLVVSPKTNLWHCLGACQAGGSVIDWVMRSEGVSFRHAVELLRNDYVPVAAVSAAAPVKHSTVTKLATPIEHTADEQRVLGQVIDYYQQTLRDSPDALAYLATRGIGSDEAIRTFKLGYANRTLGYRLPAKNRVEGAVLRGQLQTLGLLRPSGHEHFTGSLVIPVIAPDGAITEVYGRKIGERLREGTPLHLYLPGPHRGVWNEAALSASPEVILCESLIDALTFWCAGYRNVTASYGVEGFTADHLAAFKRHGIERVLIAYDRDAAGDSAAEKLATSLMADGFACYRVQFPKGMDANEYALKVGPASKSLGVVIRSAVWLGNGVPPMLTTCAGEPALALPVLSMDAPAPTSPAMSAVSAAVPSLAAAVEPIAALPAAVIPDAPRPAPIAEEKAVGSEHERIVTFGDRRYRVRGLDKNTSFEQLKINLLVSRPSFDGVGEAVHVDTLDLYQAKARSAFVKPAAAELGVGEAVIQADLGKLLLALEAAQEAQRIAAQQAQAPTRVALSEADHAAALELLRAPDLIERIVADVGRCGIVGEATNVLMGVLAGVSRLLDRPLALLIQSTSAAGKSALMDAILRFVPASECVRYSAMTGQSLFYLGETDLKHKVLAIAEEEGASRASYALKLLQSEGELTIASTSKDATTGKLVTEEYHVEGPVMIVLTTTAAEIDEELLNRCLVLSVDEGRQQTQAIHHAQRERRTLAGLLARTERDALVTRHQNAQRLLEPLAVVNPYADRLTFLDDRTRTRRDHEKYLTLIDAIALLHQHQRPIRTLAHGERMIRYVEVTAADIALANRLAHDVLGRTLDELPPQTRRLLGAVGAFVADRCAMLGMSRGDVRFSRRDVREATHWGDTQLKVHLARLVELEYLLIHRGGRGQSFEYELLYDGAIESTAPHLVGLIDVAALDNAQDYDAVRSGLEAERSALGRGAVGASSAGGRANETPFNASADAASSSLVAALEETAVPRRVSRSASYRNGAGVAARSA